MYVPRHFAEEDPDVLRQFMQDYNFATFVTQHHGQMVASHLPFMLAANEGAHGTLYAHLAKANPQAAQLDGQNEALVIFQGPHTYISPTLYEQPDVNVPTWNYAVIHAYGVPKVIDNSAQLQHMLDELVDYHEAGSAEPYSTAQAAAHVERLMPGIVAFRLEITRLEGKFKLSQNRSLTDRAQVREALAVSERADDQAMAGLMRPK